MKSHPEGTKAFHVDRQIGMMKLTVTFRNLDLREITYLSRFNLKNISVAMWCRDCGFKSHWEHGHLSLVIVLRCHVEVSATS
jgi:hypothetical protein